MITVTITKTLEDWWGADGLSDEEIRELMREDLIAMIDGATWDVQREDESRG